MTSNGITRVTRSSSRRSVSTQQEPLRSGNRQECGKLLETSFDSDNIEEKTTFKSREVRRTPTKQKSRVSESELAQISPVTPTKLKKTDNLDPGEVLATPSSLLKKLTLTSPLKKNSEATSKKSLFTENINASELEKNYTINRKTKTKEGKEVFPENCDVSTTKQNSESRYQNARKALHSNFPTNMPGREKEIEEISHFIVNHLDNQSSGSIYISGPPGTGKTASLNLILEQENIASQVQKIYINCTAIKSATTVYSRLNKELNIKATGKSEKENQAAFEKYLKKRHNTVVIVLDEIDQLETKNHSILYTIFEWPSRHDSGVILVGIANALDLTDRMLPRLQARCELKPKLLHFAPYSKDQIVHIFTSRLTDAGVLEVFSPIALQMLASKVASISGDVRRALDIGRRVVELIDENKKCDILKSVENFTIELENQSKSVENDESRKVNLKEVVNVLNNVYGTSQNLTDDTEETFPLQQKIVVCSLLLMLKKAKNKDITVGKLHEVYSKVCTKRNLTSVDQAEFVGLCSLIETRGIIKVSGKKEPRMHKVTLEWNDTEVSEALRDKQLISTILQDESVLGKV